MRTHREAYPEQYQHPIVGKRCRLKIASQRVGVVERVVSTRFGPLAVFEGDDPNAPDFTLWRVADLERIN